MESVKISLGNVVGNVDISAVACLGFSMRNPDVATASSERLCSASSDKSPS